MAYMIVLSLFLAKISDGGSIFLLILGGVLAFIIFCCYLYDKGAASRDEDIKEKQNRIHELIEKHKADLKKIAEVHGNELMIWKEQNANMITKRRLELTELENKLEEERIKYLIQIGDKERRITELEAEIAEYKAIESMESDARSEIAEMIAMMKSDTIIFPSVSERLLDLYKLFDEYIENRLSDRAFKAKEEVSKARACARKWKSDYFFVKTRMEVYEAMAPWLESYMDCTLDEVLEAKKEEDACNEERNDDNSRRYLTAEEYNNLSEVERNQRALERYWDQRVKRNLWLIGIQYERYVGYLYEKEGYNVVYHGAIRGVEDLGVDLIATKGKITRVIQCKRYSEIKKIPVRENAIAQIYGAAKVYQFEKGLKKVIPMMVTSYELSDEARKFAAALGVEVKEKLKLAMYPCIKCNINRVSGERIYHLPFDQQYDTVVIEKDKGELYAETVQEAHLRGFRRAYRWKGAIK